MTTMMLPRRADPDPAYGALAGFLGAGLAAGALGGAATASSVRTWYPTLEKPPFNPPSWVFGPVWTTLYVAMGVSAWRLWRRREDPRARRLLGLWGAQWALNAAWSPLFFGARRPDAALVDILALGGTLAAYTAGAAKVDRVAAALFVPYLAWVGFATLLNEEVWRRNRPT